MQRFWAKVERGSKDECWEWTSPPTPDGYGKFRFNGHFVRAHRFAWQLVYGAIPKGLCVCHRCDNPLCVNTRHLFLATSAENTADSMRKGRRANGEKNGNAKLTMEAVREVLRLFAQGKSGAEIGKRFGVTDVAVLLIKNGKQWRHVSQRKVTYHANQA